MSLSAGIGKRDECGASPRLAPPLVPPPPCLATSQPPRYAALPPPPPAPTRFIIIADPFFPSFPSATRESSPGGELTRLPRVIKAICRVTPTMQITTPTFSRRLSRPRLLRLPRRRDFVNNKKQAATAQLNGRGTRERRAPIREQNGIYSSWKTMQVSRIQFFFERRWKHRLPNR